MSTEIIDEILDEFNFELVHRTMKALDWTWYGSDGVPTIGEIRRRARELLRELIKDNHRCIASGGLYAYKEDGLVGLRFEVTSYEVEKETV
jgi:hypothetical protein